MLALNALHHFAKTVPFCTRNHFLEEDPKQKPTNKVYLAPCVIAKHFIGTTRGLAGSIFVADVLYRQQNLCCQSESGTILISGPFSSSHHTVGIILVIPALV